MGLLKKKGFDFSLDIIGPASENISRLISQNGLEKEVYLRGEMQQSELVIYLRKSDALILYSRYETFGCVLIEANACGVPVIVPDTQLMNELVKNGQNGVLVHPGSSIALADALIDFSTKKLNFSRNKIAEETAAKYGFSRVGKMYSEIYSRFIKG
jgi:glycosyltransferase involved in cell wall biosynthesis